ncbi:hypothetical protein BYT27DRAFT_7259310, partial [Phlegmacium glaucopus]
MTPPSLGFDSRYHDVHHLCRGPAPPATPGPSKKPAPAAMPGHSKKPAPVKKEPATVKKEPAPTKKPAPAKRQPAPAPSNKRKKVIKSDLMVISDDDEVDHRPSKKRTFAELDREDDITAYVDSVIAGVRHEITVVADDMEGVEDRMDQSDALVDTWLQKNVTAEGEVTVLRERVEAQEILIGELQHRLARAEALIKALVHTEMHPARVSREPVDLPAPA